MASPTPPILASLILEALRRSGYANPSSDLQARARDRWIEELKAEIWARAKKLKSLQTQTATILTNGLGIYNNPSDFAADMKMRYATGARYGALQAGAAGSVTLAASDTGTPQETIGKQLIITSGTGLGGISYISSFNETTKVAGLSPSLTTAPAVSSGYMVLDYYQPLCEKPVWDHALLTLPYSQGIPVYFYPRGHVVGGSFILSPIPYRNDSQPQALIQEYYADITELDTTASLMLSFYQKWQPLWIAGLRWKCLQNDDDNRAMGAFQEYQKAFKEMERAETYGNNVNELIVTVGDY